MQQRRCGGARQGEKRENPHKLAPPPVALMTAASNAVMTEQESEGRDDDNERLNQQTDRQLVSLRKEVRK